MNVTFRYFVVDGCVVYSAYAVSVDWSDAYCASSLSMDGRIFCVISVRGWIGRIFHVDSVHGWSKRVFRVASIRGWMRRTFCVVFNRGCMWRVFYVSLSVDWWDADIIPFRLNLLYFGDLVLRQWEFHLRSDRCDSGELNAVWTWSQFYRDIPWSDLPFTLSHPMAVVVSSCPEMFLNDIRCVIITSKIFLSSFQFAEMPLSTLCHFMLPHIQVEFWCRAIPTLDISTCLSKFLDSWKVDITWHYICMCVECMYSCDL